jgi:hypothetical protein
MRHRQNCSHLSQSCPIVRTLREPTCGRRIEGSATGNDPAQAKLRAIHWSSGGQAPWRDPGHPTRRSSANALVSAAGASRAHRAQIREGLRT